MTYSEQIKKSKEVLGLIKGLKDQEVLEFSYGKGFKGEPIVYTIKCCIYKNGKVYYRIWTKLKGMNVGKLTSTRANCYTYDMMSQITNYSFKLWEMKVGLTVTK